MSNWSQRTDVPKGAAYDARWASLEASGQNIHGEADLVSALLASEDAGQQSQQVLDAGCGTGRVAIELNRRGVDVVGVDLDASMLAEAKRKSPDMVWLHADLSSVNLSQQFDMIVMAGNVMIFLVPGTEALVLANLASHLKTTGMLLAGFQLGKLDLATYDHHAKSAGLVLCDRWATWQQEPYRGGNYAVSLHRRSRSSE